MKKYLLVTAIFSISLSIFAHEGSKWDKKYGDNKERYEDGYKKNKGEKHKGYGKFSTNIPARVAESFYHDFPYANNTYWSKEKGNWIATFNNGATRTKAVYHANGERLYTSNGNPIYVPAPNQGKVYTPGNNPAPGQQNPDPRNYGGVGNKTTPQTAPQPAPQPGRPDPKNYGGL